MPKEKPPTPEEVSGVVIALVNCARCGTDLLGERTKAALDRAGVTGRRPGLPTDAVFDRVGGRPYCKSCFRPPADWGDD